MKVRVALAVVVSALAVVAPACNGGKAKAKYPTRCASAPGSGVEWARCNLRGADLRGVDLTGALIHDVDLGGADLTGADLSNATLVNVFAEDAKLKDATLEGATVNGGDIHLAIYCHTTMPNGKVADSGC
jgi:uncharacterized protein YjbI with pentapeptide repeats